MTADRGGFRCQACGGPACEALSPVCCACAPAPVAPVGPGAVDAPLAPSGPCECALTGVAPCGCPVGPGRTINDPARHAAWHQLVVEQGGPAGEVSLTTLRVSRGLPADMTSPDTATRLIDDRAVASGKRRSSPARYREARAAVDRPRYGS